MQRRCAQDDARRGAWLLGAALLVLVALAPRPVRACSCADPAASIDLVQPADGAVGVPRNARVFLGGKQVLSSDGFGEKAPASLLDDEGRAVPTRETEVRGGGLVLVLHPEAPLEPGGRYTVVVAGQPLSRFTVGEVSDDVPPAPPRVVGVETHSSLDFLPLGVASSCGPDAGARFGLEGVAAFTLAVVGDGDTLDEANVSGEVSALDTDVVLSVGRFACDASWPDARPLASANVRFGTYDLAGNFSGWSDPRGVVLPPPGCRCDALGAATDDAPAFGLGLGLLVTAILRRRATPRRAGR